MPRVIFAPAAVRDVARLRDFLNEKKPHAAKRATDKIFSSLRSLEQFPQMGRAVADLPVEFREILIPFGGGGYVARYRYTDADLVEILAIRHYREVGFNLSAFGRHCRKPLHMRRATTTTTRASLNPCAPI